MLHDEKGTLVEQFGKARRTHFIPASDAMSRHRPRSGAGACDMGARPIAVRRSSPFLRATGVTMTPASMVEPDLNLLIALEVLLSEGTVAGAARRLGLSSSAMSRTLARLRAATGDPLLVRAGRGLVPTPRAKELRERVQNLTREVRAVLRPAPDALDIRTVEQTFTIRTNDGFVEAFAARLVSAVAAAAPGVRLRFAAKADKDVRVLREGLIDLEIGVLGATGPEVRVQTLFRDRFIGVVREGHPLLGEGEVTPERYAACGHVVASRPGRPTGPVDEALAALGLARTVVAVVPGFRAALSVARGSDLVALLTASFLDTVWKDDPLGGRGGVQSFALPVSTPPIVVSQMWHPRLDADRVHRWLRGVVHGVCQEQTATKAAALPHVTGKRVPTAS
jgi:DNA-binding transcriptional LysR family regulator